MYKVLLADDEQIVIDSLGFILERNFPGQIETFTARSGADAIGACQANKVDIAFMDINMPGLNGIEAIKAIKAFSPTMVIVVLTAFDRFDYAQQAVNLGVFEYLSKPVNRNKIAETMRNAMSAVDALRRKQVSEIQIREKLDSVVNIVESDFIYSLIFPGDKNHDLESYLDFFNIKGSSFYFLSCELPEIDEETRSRVYVTLRDVIASSGPCIIGPFMRNRVVVFVPFTPGPRADSDFEEIQGSVKALLVRLATRLGMNVRIGVSGVEEGFDRSLAAYNDSLNALLHGDGQNSVFFAADFAHRGGAADYPEGSEKKLLDRASAGDFQSVHSLLSELVNWIAANGDSPMDALRWKLSELLALVRNRARELEPSFGGFGTWKETWSEMNALADPREAEAFARTALDECIAVINGHKISRMSPTIAKACEIIQADLASDIPLEEIARQVEISPFYFSKLFKEETGENFIDYLTSARVGRAKELLGDPAKSIKEISAETGYSDPNYFSKIFKKTVGLTPTEFRERQ